MWSLLDTIGASAIGGMVLMLIISINLQMNSHSTEVVENNIVQSNLTSTTENIKYDFYKIGYKTSGSKISIADSNQIKFYADINNDDLVDTIMYLYVSPIANLEQPNNNPNGKLYKSQNGGENQIASIASNFKLTYFDSTGQTISYLNLSNQQFRNRIKTIKIDMMISSDYKINDVFQKSDWSSVINPKNLR